MVPLDILMESSYVSSHLLDMSKFKSLNKSTRKTHKKLVKCFSIEKDTEKVNCSSVPMEWTVAITFKAKTLRIIESKSLFQLLRCWYSTSGHSLLILMIFSQALNFPVIIIFNLQWSFNLSFISSLTDLNCVNHCKYFFHS